MYQQNSPSLLSLFGTVIVFVIIAGYGMVSLSTEDPLWFVPIFDEQASDITLYCRGNMMTFDSTSPHRVALNNMINENLSGMKNWDSLTMSADTYEYYRTSDAVIVLEYNYNSPVRVHSIYKYFSDLDSIVVPLEGRHSKTNAIFGRNNGEPTAGALHIQSPGLMLDYVEANGLCN